MSKIIFTGGGTAGHVVPNIALISELIKDGNDIKYIGSKNGIEKRLIEELNIPYYKISTGKLRRYLDIKNFTDPFKVLCGIYEAIKIMKKEKPKILFSKGGFVAVPVVIAAWLNKIPVIIHESDMTPGLANKICSKFATKICVNFPETLKYVDKSKALLTGTPIRSELKLGSKLKGYEICGFDKSKHVIMFMGGSLGSKFLNDMLRECLSELLKNFQIVHLCGKGNLDESLVGKKGYKQFEYVTEELPHIFKISDIIISRAGANSIYEFLQLKKPSLLIPLSKKASRGDQILNAKSFEKQKFSKVIEEEEINKTLFMDTIMELYNNKDQYINYIEKSELKDGKKIILDLINKNMR